jgi:hypothetical protein
MQGEIERKGDPSSSQSCLQQLHVQLHISLLFLLPNRNLNQTSKECPFKRVCVRERERERERERVETMSEG